MSLRLSSKQKDLYNNSTAKINVAHGAVRSGKTFAVNLRWLKYIRQGPPGKLLMSGRTKDSLKENVLDDLFRIVGEHNYTYKESKGELTIFGRKIKCVGAEKIDSEYKIRGQTYAGWYGDEITIQHPSFVKQAITRNSVAGAQIFWTTNPDHPKHHIKKDFIDNPDMLSRGQLKYWHFLLPDNLTLTDDYVDLLKASFSGVFYARNILGEWVIAEGVVYGNDYDPAFHRVPREQILQMIANNEFHYYIAGTDWGYTAPMTGLLYGVTKDLRYFQIDEFYEVNKQTEDIARWYLDWESRLGRKIDVIYCDSAEPDRIVTMRKMKLRAKEANKDIASGINSVQVCFKQNRLFISDHCDNTDLELQTYRYPDEDDIKYKRDLPLDDDNHAMDGKRYAIHNFEIFLIKSGRLHRREGRTLIV